MRLHRFYIEEKISGKTTFIISSVDLVKQVKSVFRLKSGDKIIVFDGSGNDYQCSIESFNSEKEISLQVVEIGPSRYMPARKIFLYQSIIKKDKFEWVVEKATELGVTDIVPIITEHSEKKSLNEERLRKIAIEASEQCGRGDIPMIHPVEKGLPSLSSESMIKIVFSTSESNSDLSSLKGTGTIAIFIGPEGGWSPEELEMFHNQKIVICSLGKQILRAETAAVVALSKVLM